MPSPGHSPRVPELDGLRGVAIALVLVWHYVVVARSAWHPALRFLNLTWSGVDLFFVLSGFLIGGILLDSQGNEGYFRTFYVRRMFRILPAYTVCLTFFAVARICVPSLAAPRATWWLFGGAMPIWTYATFTQNFAMANAGTLGANWLAVTWSLAIEEQFYLLLPLSILVVPRIHLPLTLGIFVAMAPVLRLFFALYHQHTMLPGYVLTICRADALLLGVASALAVRSEGGKVRLQRHAWKLRVGFILFMGAALALAYEGQTVGSFGMTIVGQTLLALAYASLLLLAVSKEDGIAARMLRTRWLSTLGGLAYGIYLAHQAVNGLMHGLLRQELPSVDSAGAIVITLASLLVTLLLAFLSWRYFEGPLVALGHGVRDGLPVVPPRRAG